MGNGDLIPSLCIGGRYFDDLPYFEKYRFEPDWLPELDYSSAGGDLLQEMLLDADAAADDEWAYRSSFLRTPYDHYDELRVVSRQEPY